MIDVKEQAGIAMNVRGQLSDPIADPQVTLGALAFANDLGRLLWRMKYGQDVRQSGLHRATLLLANRIRHAGKFERAKFTGLDRAARRDRDAGKRVEREKADIVERFARRLIIEWVVDLCTHCEGRGVIGRSGRCRTMVVEEAQCATCSGSRFVCISEERIPFAAGANGKGPIVYREYERCSACNGRGNVRIEREVKRIGRQICPHCGGSGRYPVDAAARALALGVTLDVYRNQWERYFVGMLAVLDKVDSSAADTVMRQVRA